MGYRFRGDRHALDSLFTGRRIGKLRPKKRSKKVTLLRQGTMIEKEWLRIKRLLAFTYEETSVSVHFSPQHPDCLVILGTHLRKELANEVFGLGGSFEYLRGKERTRLPFKPSDFFWISTRVRN